MNPFNEEWGKPLPNQRSAIYQGIAYDGNDYYLTCPEHSMIVQYDRDFQEISSVKTRKAYTCICYDQQDDCFWAATGRHYRKLFCLNTCFEEIDCAAVGACSTSGLITGVSYSCCDNRLLVSFEDCVLLVEKGREACAQLLRRSQVCLHGGVLAVSPDWIVTSTDGGKQQITVYSGDGCLKYRKEIPSCYRVETVILTPGRNPEDGQYHFSVLATKNHFYSWLLEWSVDAEESDLEICCCNYLLLGDWGCKCCLRNCFEQDGCSGSLVDEGDCTADCADLLPLTFPLEIVLGHLSGEAEELLEHSIACAQAEQILCVRQLTERLLEKISCLQTALDRRFAVMQASSRQTGGGEGLSGADQPPEAGSGGQ